MFRANSPSRARLSIVLMVDAPGAAESRDRWFDVLCAEVLTLAGPSIDIVRHYTPLSSRPDLGASAVVVLICNQARRALATVRIAEQLVASGVLPGCAWSEVTTLVREVRLRWAALGLPIADWWNDGQLLGTLLSYLAPRIAAEQGDAEARSHLRDVFGLTTEPLIDELVAYPLSPPLLPPVPRDLVVSGDAWGAAGIRVLAEVASRAETDTRVAELRSRSLLGGGGPRRCGHWEHRVSDDLDEWLRHGQDMVLTWAVLHRLIGYVETEGNAAQTDGDLADFEPDSLAEAQAIINAAWQQCVDWLSSLTTAEQMLIQVYDPDELRRRRWLDGHLRIKHASLLIPDGVPDITSAGATPHVPDWVNTFVYDRGARFFHNATGPLELWFGVVESDHEQHQLRSALEEGVRMGITHDGADILLQIAVEPKGSLDPAFAPFHFSPDEPRSAIELLLAALTSVRIDWYRLHDDRTLEHLYGSCLDIPADVLAPILERVDATLARAELDAPESSPYELLTQAFMHPDSEQFMFVGVDNAKSESILFDLDRLDMGSDHDTEAIGEARDNLARAELARVSAEVDGIVDEQVQAEADLARRSYTINRQRVQRPVGRQFADMTAHVVSAERAFVQFAESEGYLSAVVAIETGDGVEARFIDLGNITVDRIRLISDNWIGRDTDAPWEEVADALDILVQWAGQEIVAPVFDLLVQYSTRHVVLCPSRTLEPLPLHAAVIDGNALGDLVDVSYAPSAAVLSRLSGRSYQHGTLDLIVAANGAHAPRSHDLDVLEGPDQEASALHELAAHARVLNGVDATPDAVLKAIADSRVTHLAAHGEASPDKLASGIWLSGTTPSAALLSAAAIHAGPELRKTSLVVLSACDTAHHPTGGRAVQAWRGLDSAFLARGARAVVAGLWEVDDVAALVYSTTLHVRLFHGTTVAQAHTNATTVLRGSDPDPRTTELLDKVRPSWRTDLHELQLDRAYWWSSYRPSGVCW
jgi:CHAT domain-containing protein